MFYTSFQTKTHYFSLLAWLNRTPCSSGLALCASVPPSARCLAILNTIGFAYLTRHKEDLLHLWKHIWCWSNTDWPAVLCRQLVLCGLFFYTNITGVPSRSYFMCLFYQHPPFLLPIYCLHSRVWLGLPLVWLKTVLTLCTDQDSPCGKDNPKLFILIMPRCWGAKYVLNALNNSGPPCCKF